MTAPVEVFLLGAVARQFTASKYANCSGLSRVNLRTEDSAKQFIIASCRRVTHHSFLIDGFVHSDERPESGTDATNEERNNTGNRGRQCWKRGHMLSEV